MQVFLTKNENGTEEWLLIEMQGTIENGGVTFNSEMIGNLAWRKDDSEALLLVGHHLIEGKLSQLEKPFLVTIPQNNGEERSLLVKAIVKRKLSFKNRPKPIVTKTLVKKSALQEIN